ncbi:hypothetical protein, partial [uncultured Rhodoblastus sp.]|uniref:hypothetical protein n=1 Tax=uncultured Rhodoblastus sp. TaxID=543037 RepID=UPI0025E0FFFA
MYTLSELAMLRAVDNNAVLPGIDTKTGNQVPASSLTQLSQISQLKTSDYWYDPAANMVRVV